jgi:nicotinate dehydrogenase subunit A
VITPRPTSPAAPAVGLTLNGRRVEVAEDPDTPLLTVLRDTLQLVGTRFGCGQGLCGACFVRVDDDRGSTVLPSCQTPLWQVADTRVTTVEGLSEGGRPHPVQRALLEHQAAQCGFCTAGIVVRAATLLEQEPDADEERVTETLEQNLCRCGAHRRVVAAVLAARERG